MTVFDFGSGVPRPDSGVVPVNALLQPYSDVSEERIDALRPELQRGLEQALQDMPPELRKSVRITSGYRSPQDQYDILTRRFRAMGRPVTPATLARGIPYHVAGVDVDANGNPVRSHSQHANRAAVDIDGSDAALHWLHEQGPAKYGFENPSYLRATDRGHFQLTGSDFASRVQNALAAKDTRELSNLLGPTGDGFENTKNMRASDLTAFMGNGAAANTAPSSPQDAARAEMMGYAMDELRKRGVPDANVRAAAAHLVGQAEMENGQFDPRAIHDNGTGLGIFGAGGDRKTAMLDWAKKNNYDPYSREGQMRAMVDQAMSGDYPQTKAILMGATPKDLMRDSWNVTKDFERPRYVNDRSRAVLSAYNGGGSQAPDNTVPFSDASPEDKMTAAAFTPPKDPNNPTPSKGGYSSNYLAYAPNAMNQLDRLRLLNALNVATIAPIAPLSQPPNSGYVNPIRTGHYYSDNS